MNKVSLEMALGALGFADGDIDTAFNMVEKAVHDTRDGEDRRADLRCKFAVRRLKSSLNQINAAISLLENGRF